jgi:hypothetical protein
MSLKTTTNSGNTYEGGTVLSFLYEELLNEIFPLFELLLAQVMSRAAFLQQFKDVGADGSP